MMNGMRVSFLNRFLRMTAVVLVAAFAFLLTGCGGSSASTSFTWFVDNIPANLDPQVATKAEDVIACENLYGGLVRRNASGELVPDLCERWEISSDGLTYTFYLKSGLTYTGTKGAATDYAITAEDFVYAFRRVFDPQTASPYAVEFSAIQNSAAVLDGTADPGTLGVSAIGELTLVFRLSERDDTFLSKLTLPGAMPCDEAFFESTRGTYGLSSTSTLSSGSFYIYNWTASGLFLRRSAASPLVNNLRLVQNTSNTDKSAAQLIADEKCSAALDDTAEATSLQSVEYSDTTWALLFNASEGSVFAVASLRQALAEAGAPQIRIFAKIENLAGVQALPEFLSLVDEVVIARGDLGNAMPLWELPRCQKQLSAICRAAGVPFMVVTQMLDSMHTRAVPTRAEVSDIYNAVLDGASSLMLTGETAAGQYPVQAMEYLVRTARTAM